MVNVVDTNSTDYFEQICNLSKDPISIMSKYNTLHEMKNALKNNYNVYKIDDKYAQIYLSACYKKTYNNKYLSSQKIEE